MGDFQEERVDAFGRIITGDRDDHDESRDFARRDRSNSLNDDQGKRQSFGDAFFSPPLPRGGDRRYRGGDRGRGGNGGGGFMGRGGRDDFDNRRIGGPHGQNMGRLDRFERGGPPDSDRFPSHGNGPPPSFQPRGMQPFQPSRDGRLHAIQTPMIMYEPKSNRLVPRGNTRINFMPPLMSFKSFMVQQVDEFGTSEVYNQRYEEFQYNYIDDFSNIFFHNNKTEEWFNERYNPIKIQEKEVEMTEWSSSESAHFLEQLVSNPTEFIKLASLDKSSDGQSNVVAESISTSHIQDHNKAVLVTGVRANCPTSVFKAAVIDALTAKGLALPNRIIIAQPQWSTDIPIKFERCAWVLMPTIEAATGAEACLKDLKIFVPMPIYIDSADTEQDIMFSFSIQTQIFNPQAGKQRLLKPFVSQAPRVLSDILKAQELAALFDNLRNVPEELALKSILDQSKHPEVINAFSKATEKLDIAIAYLRRVHFVSFYGATRYHDEAHLLFMCPELHFRSVPCALSVEGILKSEASDANNDSKDTEVLKSSFKRKAESSIDKDRDVDEIADDDEARQNEQDQGEHDQDESENKDQQEEQCNEGDEGVVEKDDAKQVLNVRMVKVGMSDKKINYMIRDLSKTLRIRETSINSIKGPNNDDSKILADRVNDAIDDKINDLCPVEKEGKARCCYKSCNKLFKGPEFLKKHIISKHESFASDIILKITEPVMLKIYNSEDIMYRPLPPVDVELLGGIEVRSVKEVLDSAKSSRLPSSSRGGGRDSFSSHDRNDRRQSFPSRNSKGADSDKLLPSYMDIDAPKVIFMSLHILIYAHG